MGGGILVDVGYLFGPGSDTRVTIQNVFVDGNFVYDYLTTLSGSPSTEPAAGGIVAINAWPNDVDAENITITNNVVNQGYGYGVSTYGLKSCYVKDNSINNASSGALVDQFSATRLVNAEIGAYTAAPTIGTWARGTVIYNSTPSSGGYVGWVCTASGTPGTWKQFGVIA